MPCNVFFNQVKQIIFFVLELNLGTQEEAAESYDVAAIKFRGLNAVTNFDMSKYNVEKIMASNTLLVGEQARRTTKKIKDCEEPKPEAKECNNNVVSNQITNSEEIEAVNNNETNNWNQSPQQQESNTCDQKTVKFGNFSMSLQDIIGIDSVGGSSQVLVDDDSTNKMKRTHFSNSSSLVTSLSSSRECSPDNKSTGPTMLFPKPPIGSKNLSPIATTNVGSWFPSSSAISIPHFPVFAAWSDA
jgi:AP2-like factor (ANT lineage)